MYKSKTVFIVGAGAGVDIAMPTGKELVKDIQNRLDFRDLELGYSLNHGFIIEELVRKCTDGDKFVNDDEFRKYQSAGTQIFNALPLAISIDNSVDSFQNPYVTTVAKFAITESILDAENKCKLMPIKDSQGKLNIDWKQLENSWLPELFKSINENLAITNIENIFENITFINFNYDRVLEHFLSNAIEHYYGISSRTAQEIVNQANIFHPYGTVGKLPWQSGDKQIMEFGGFKGNHLSEISKGIKTFTEQIDDDTYLNKIREAIHIADQLIFLGFGFHDQNMDLLQPNRTKNTDRVIATAKGISDSDCLVITDRLGKLCADDEKLFRIKGDFYADSRQFEIDNQIDCLQLFKKYQRTIRS